MSRSESSNGTVRKIVVLQFVLIYVACVVLGCVIIWAIPMMKNRGNLMDLAREKGEYVLALDSNNAPWLFGMEYRLYNSEGTLIYIESEILDKSEQVRLESYLPELFEKGAIFKPAYFTMDNGGSYRSFGVMVGVVVTPPSGRQFACIVVRDFADLDSSMLTYVALFTIMYAVAVGFSVRLVRKERELNRLRRELTANVSHELKTPITTIRAMAEVLYDDMEKDRATRRKYSGQIMEEADRLERLVLDMLELSKLRSKRWEFKKDRVCADALLTPTIDRYMMLCADVGFTMDISGLELDKIPRLYTDRERATSLFGILMDNAVKFTKSTIRVTQELHPRYVTFGVQDDGEGIRPEDIARIFDRFYKTDVAHNSKGSGLGLAIATEIAAGLNEKLWVESEYGKGAAFYFTIHF